MTFTERSFLYVANLLEQMDRPLNLAIYFISTSKHMLRCQSIRMIFTERSFLYLDIVFEQLHRLPDMAICFINTWAVELSQIEWSHVATQDQSVPFQKKIRFRTGPKTIALGGLIWASLGRLL